VAISDKNRKILWAQSGNICAICRKKLVFDPTQADGESVVGEECHIYAQSAGGPRFNPAFTVDQIDSLDNLILLCANDHKRVDDQPQTHTAEWLQARKADHAMWVEKRLADPTPQPMRIIRTKANVPHRMERIASGKVLLHLAMQCHSSNTDFDDDLDDAESELVASFLQDVHDYREIAGDVDMAEHIKITRSLNTRLRELEEKGFYFFAAVEGARIEGGERPPQPWMIFHELVTRATNPKILWKEESDVPPDA